MLAVISCSGSPNQLVQTLQGNCIDCDSLFIFFSFTIFFFLIGPCSSNFVFGIRNDKSFSVNDAERHMFVIKNCVEQCNMDTKYKYHLPLPFSDFLRQYLCKASTVNKCTEMCMYKHDLSYIMYHAE